MKIIIPLEFYIYKHYIREKLILVTMNKCFNYALIFLCSLCVISCTIAVYYQNHTSDSKIEVSNPTSLSADSAQVDVETSLNLP